MRKAIQTSAASSGDGPYSQAIIARGSIYVSGQGPLDPQSNAIVGSTIEEQTRQTMENIKNILASGGCTMDDVVKMNVFLANLQDFKRFNEVYASYFTQPMPARTCVEAGLDNILVEIDAIAFLPREGA